jgi:hypothetical protein
MQKRDEVNTSISIFVELAKKVVALSSLQGIQNLPDDIMKGSAQSVVENDGVQ